MDRKFQIFISSTYVDLIEERKSITAQILKDYHFPIGMEMFVASDNEQWKTITKTIDSSDIYILVLGYRYGSTVSEIDPDTKQLQDISYTEKEYIYAKKHAKPTLVFMKEDDSLVLTVKKLEAMSSIERSTLRVWKETLKKIQNKQFTTLEVEQLQVRPSGNDVLQYLYDNFYDSDQTAVQKFRAEASKSKVVEFFSKQIDIRSSISKNVKDLPTGGWVREKNLKRAYVKTPKYLAILAILIVAMLFFGYWLSDRQSVAVKLIKNNPQLFDQKPASEALPTSNPERDLEYARVFASSAALNNETASRAERITAATDTFKIYTPMFGSLKDLESVLISSIKRGVKFRILLLDDRYDYGLNQFWYYDPDTNKQRKRLNFAHTTLAETLANTTTLMGMNKTYKGAFEIRFTTRPMYYGMWISDPGKANGIAHFTISKYNSFQPTFRVTMASSKRLFNELNNQFDIEWAAAKSKSL